MAENPYSPPQHPTHSELGLPGVVVRGRFPLDIIAHRAVAIDTEGLDHRIRWAAQSCGFRIETQTAERWTLRRGSLWHAVYTFGVRKLPASVTIVVISPTRLHIEMLCTSPLTISTPGDEKRISRELDELEERLVFGS